MQPEALLDIPQSEEKALPPVHPDRVAVLKPFPWSEWEHVQFLKSSLEQAVYQGKALRDLLSDDTERGDFANSVLNPLVDLQLRYELMYKRMLDKASHERKA